jgi:hypothetical protein
MFDFNEGRKENVEKEIIESRAKREAEKEMMNFLTDMLLASNMPESSKDCLRIINASRDIEELIHDTATEATLNDDNLNVENAKKYLLMIIACHNQIKAFLESNPLVMNAEGEKREADER